MKWNGNIELNTDGTSEIRNLVTERVTTNPAFSAGSDEGRIIYNTTDEKHYIGNATAWVSIASGGNTGALQTEIDAIETSMGSFMNADGTFSPTTLNALNNITGLTGSSTLFDVISQIDTAIEGADDLFELNDTTISNSGAPAADSFLFWDQSALKWIDQLPSATRTALSLVVGTNVQAYDLALDNLSAITGTGFIVQTAANTFITTTFAVDGAGNKAGLSIADASGLGDAPTVGLNITGLAAEGGTLSGTDVVAMYDGVNNVKAAMTDIAAFTIANGIALDDVSDVDDLAAKTADLPVMFMGDGTNLDTVTLLGGINISAVSSSGVSVTLNVDDVFLSNSGDSLDSGVLTVASGANINAATGATITMVDAPTGGTEVTNKNYVDALVAGLSWKQAARIASTGNVVIATGTLLTIDGILTVAGDRVLLKDQTLPKENGVYIAGTGAWTRATDMNEAGEFSSAALYVEEGTINADTGYNQTETIATVDTDTVTFVQFSGAGTFVGGTGLLLTGNTFDVNMGAGIIALPSDEVGIDLYDKANSALILTPNGSTRTGLLTGDQLYLLLDSTTLAQSSAGLKVPTQGITENELHTSVAGDGLAGGNGTALSVRVDDSSIEITSDILNVKAAGITNAMMVNNGFTIQDDAAATDAIPLGATLSILGSGAMDTAATADTLTISVKDATTAIKGVASFNTNQFTVTSGAVSLDATVGNLSGVTTSTAADEVLVATGADAFTAKKIHHVYTGTSATSHVVTHSLGQQYVNVTIIDDTTANKDVIIPQNIRMDSATQLTVTLNSALAIKAIVTGV